MSREIYFDRQQFCQRESFNLQLEEQERCIHSELLWRSEAEFLIWVHGRARIQVIYTWKARGKELWPNLPRCRYFVRLFLHNKQSFCSCLQCSMHFVAHVLGSVKVWRVKPGQNPWFWSTEKPLTETSSSNGTTFSCESLDICKQRQVKNNFRTVTRTISVVSTGPSAPERYSVFYYGNGWAAQESGDLNIKKPAGSSLLTGFHP